MDDRPSVSQLIPDDYYQELIQLRDNLTRNKFRIGDIGAEIFLKSSGSVKMRQLALSQTDLFGLICWAVGSVVGLKSQQVENYIAIAAHFDMEAREKYSVLAMSHLSLAMQAGNREQEVLDYAMECPQITCDKIKTKFPEIWKIPPVNWDRKFRGAISTIERAMEELEWSQEAYNDLNQALLLIQKHINIEMVVSL